MKANAMQESEFMTRELCASQALERYDFCHTPVHTALLHSAAVALKTRATPGLTTNPARSRQ